jgi:transcriptional regulator with XRE-family HTH domain
MKHSLDSYVRERCNTLNISLAELSRTTGLSRQTLHTLASVPRKLPSLQTIVTLAEALRVHPLHLVHLVLDETPKHRTVASKGMRHDQSAFVRDVTFEDGAQVLSGQRFVKTWELHNVGKVAWEGRFLQCMDEDIVVHSRQGEVLTIAHNLHPTVPRVAVPHTEPGQLVQVSVEFTAPKPPGTVLSYWKSTFADGRLCFPKSPGVWVKVRVISMAPARG